MKTMLVMSGYDPTGGAGIIRDFITAVDFDVVPIGIITSYTVQDARGVKKVIPRKANEIREELEYIVQSINFSGIKIGMIFSEDIAILINDFVANTKVPLFVDLIIKSKNDTALVEQETLKFILYNMIKNIHLLHLNYNEAKIISGLISDELRVSNFYDAIELSKKLISMGCKYVALTSSEYSKTIDALIGNEEIVIYKSEKIEKEMHGTGCTFTTAIASAIISGKDIIESFNIARNYVRNKITNSVKLCEDCFYIPFK